MFIRDQVKVVKESLGREMLDCGELLTRRASPEMW